MDELNSKFGSSRGGKKRSTNFELLRILCMLLIICGHILMIHKYEKMYDSSWCINQFLKPFCAVAVNTFILISGYFGIKLNFKKLLSMNNMVTFYSVVLFFISILLGIHDLSLSKDWMQFLPVLTKQYWFISIYFVLCFISPALNLLVEALDKNKYKQLLWMGFLLFVGLPTVGCIANFPSVTTDGGYGIVNFVYLYLLGRYLRLHYVCNVKRYWYLCGYIVSMAVCCVFQILYSNFLGFTFDALISYDTLFVFIGSICLFLFFSKLSFDNNYVKAMSVNCLAVYVIHLHPLFYEYLFVDILGVNVYFGLRYIMLLIIAPCLIYIGCILIEEIRRRFCLYLI